MGQREYRNDVGTGGVQHADGFSRSRPGGDHIIDNQDRAGDRCRQPDATGDVALAIDAGEPDRVAGKGAEPQRRGNPETALGRCCRTGHASDRIAAAAPGRRPSGGRWHRRQRCVEYSPPEKLTQRRGDGGRERPDQIRTTVLLDRDDRSSTGARVSAQRQHRHAWIQPRSDDVGLAGTNRQFLFARRAPAGVGGSAATALQWENKTEHGRSVGQPTDTAATGLPFSRSW